MRSRERRIARERNGMRAGTVQSIKALGSLATVPGAISVGLLLLSLLVLEIDSIFAESISGFYGGFFAVPFETASAILTTLASGAITTLGLVYSIVLVVFTTAAGNIGPRLLQRFNKDRLNQTTAGIFGGAFLFAMATLYATTPDRVPLLSLAVALMVSVLAVLQLLLFVQSAARSVTVDEEVAAISAGLEAEMLRLADGADETRASDAVDLPPFPDDEDAQVEAEQSGYISNIDTQALKAWADTHGCVLHMPRGAGQFVLRGQMIARTDRPLSTNERRLLRLALRDAAATSPSRTTEADVAFAIHLLIEIALRALSPGVNDTYTAIACVDRLSAALAVAVRQGLPGDVHMHGDRPRLVVPGIALAGIFNLSFGPLRRAARGNVLMLAAILNALSRLYDLTEADGATARMLREHARLTLGAAQRSDLQPDDLVFLRRRHAQLYRAD